MDTAEYADKVVELISSRPVDIDLDQLLYEIYVKAKIADARRDREQGRWFTHAEVMEHMWKKINSKFQSHLKST